MAVKLKGGLAVVQDPAEAAFPEMPEQAWHYAGAEYGLPITGIERLLVNSVNGRAEAPRSSRQNGLKSKSGKAIGARISAGKALAVETQTADIENPTVKERPGMPSVYAFLTVTVFCGK